jgi:lysozyme
MLTGIDVSDCQGIIDWKKVKESGVYFAFCKATDSLTFVAKTFKRNWAGIKEGGLIRGAYHFCHTKNNPILESTHFVNTVGILEPYDMLVLDIEDDKNTLPPEQFLNWTYEFLTNVERLTGVTPIVYTGGPYFDKNGGKPSNEWINKLSRFPLWLAAYTTNPDKYVPAIWKNVGWTIWQRSGDVAAKGEKPFHVPGINCVVDKNQFRGLEKELEAFACSLHHEINPIETDLIPVDFNLDYDAHFQKDDVDKPLSLPNNFWSNVWQFLGKLFNSRK